MKIAIGMGLTVATLVYVMTAPPVDSLQTAPKFQFDGRSAIRKRPSLESAPIAYATSGSAEILHTADDWVEVRIEGTISGWTQRNQGTIISPPPPQLTPRQRAKKRLDNLFATLYGLL